MGRPIDFLMPTRAQMLPLPRVDDRAYTSGVTRRMLRGRKITAVIPQ